MIDLPATESVDDSGPVSRVTVALRTIVDLLSRARVDLSSEKRLQADVESIFQSARLRFEREHALSPQDIPDFFFSEDGIIVECKIRSANKMKTYKQLVRYAQDQRVRVIVLAGNLTMGLPPEINGKPVIRVSLSGGWL